MTLPSPQHFTDRQEALAAYDALWAPDAAQRVLNIEGLSGNGKSTLIGFLAGHHPRPAARIHLQLDFAAGSLRTGDYDVTDRLASQLRAHLPAGALATYAPAAVRRAPPQQPSARRRCTCRSTSTRPTMRRSAPRR